MKIIIEISEPSCGQIKFDVNAAGIATPKVEQLTLLVVDAVQDVARKWTADHAGATIEKTLDEFWQSSQTIGRG